MKTEPQNSIQKRMREIYSKLKGLGNHFPDQTDFEEYSLWLDRFDKSILQMATENIRALDDKKEVSKEIKAKNNSLKEIRKEFDLFKKEKEENKKEFQETIMTQKNTISELKKKLETAKESAQYFQYETLKEENFRLQKLINKEQAQISALCQQKLKMISIPEYIALKKELLECKNSLNSMCHWQRKFQALSEQNKLRLHQLQHQRVKNRHLQSVIQTQKEEIQNDGQIISCLMDDDEKISLNSSQTCESTNDYQMQDIDIQRTRKKKKNRKRNKNFQKSKIQPIQQDPEQMMTEKETQQSTEVQEPVAPTQSNTKHLRSFSIVMFILAGVLAILVPGWNC